MDEENKNPENGDQENQGTNDLNKESTEDQNQESTEDQNQGSTFESASDITGDAPTDLEKATVSQISKRWGLYLGLVLIAWSVITIIAGMEGNDYMGYATYLFIIGGMVMAHKEFKENGDGYMSYSQGLGIGTLVTLISGLISVAFSYIYVKFIDDSLIEIIKDKQLEGMQEQGLSDAQIEQALEISGSFMVPEVMFPLALVFMVFFGFIIALVVSAITKNANPAEDI